MKSDIKSQNEHHVFIKRHEYLDVLHSFVLYMGLLTHKMVVHVFRGNTFVPYHDYK